MEVLDNDKQVELFDNLGVSIAIFDRDLKMIYMNKKAQWFYNHVFHASDLLGKSVKECHQNINVKNIMGLFKQFDEGKPFSYFNVNIPIIEGGHLTVVHYPYIVDGKVCGIMEINIESSLDENGRCAYERTYNE